MNYKHVNMKKEIIIILSVLLLAMIVTGSGAIYQSTVAAGGGTILSKVSTTVTIPEEPPTETIWVDTTKASDENNDSSVDTSNGETTDSDATVFETSVDETSNVGQNTETETSAQQSTLAETTVPQISETIAPWIPETTIPWTPDTSPFVTEAYTTELFESDTGFSETSESEATDETYIAETEPSDNGNGESDIYDTETDETSQIIEDTAVAETETEAQTESADELFKPEGTLYLTEQTLQEDLKYLFDMFCYLLKTYPQDEIPNMNYYFEKGMTQYKQRFGNYTLLKRFAQEYYSLVDSPIFTDTSDNIYEFKIFIEKNNRIGSIFDYNNGKDYTALAVYIKCNDVVSGKILHAVYTSEGYYFNGSYYDLLGITSISGDLYDRLLDLFH